MEGRDPQGLVDTPHVPNPEKYPCANFDKLLFRQAWTNFDNFVVNSISRLSKIICISLHFYLLYLLLNSCDENDAKRRVFLVRLLWL